jgi:hypothetical protein
VPCQGLPEDQISKSCGYVDNGGLVETRNSHYFRELAPIFLLEYEYTWELQRSMLTMFDVIARSVQYEMKTPTKLTIALKMPNPIAIAVLMDTWNTVNRARRRKHIRLNLDKAVATNLSRYTLVQYHAGEWGTQVEKSYPCRRILAKMRKALFECYGYGILVMEKVALYISCLLLEGTMWEARQRSR